MLESGFAIEVSGEGADRDPAGREPLDHPIGAGRAGRPRACGVRAAAGRAQHDPARPRPGVLLGGDRGRPGGGGRRWPASDLDRGLGAAARQRHRGPSGQRRGRDLRRVRAGVRGPDGVPWPSEAGCIRTIGAAVFIPDGSVETAAARGLLPERSRTSTPPPTPAGPPCWCTRWPTTPIGCGTPRGTGCTSTTGNRPCRGRTQLVTALRAAGFRRGDQRGRAIGPGARPRHPARRPGGVSDPRVRAAALRHRGAAPTIGGSQCTTEYWPGVLAF